MGDLFGAIDTNNDGVIDRAEFAAAVRHGPCLSTMAHACATWPMLVRNCPCLSTMAHACAPWPMLVRHGTCLCTMAHACPPWPMLVRHGPCLRGSSLCALFCTCLLRPDVLYGISCHSCFLLPTACRDWYLIRRPGGAELTCWVLMAPSPSRPSTRWRRRPPH